MSQRPDSPADDRPADLRAREQEIAALRAAARRQDTRLAQLTHLALDLEKELIAARTEADRWEQRYHTELAEWEGLRHSPGYALLQTLQRLRARLAPTGSRREGLLTMAAGWLRIANERGGRGLLRHLRGEVRWRRKALLRRLSPRRKYRNDLVEIPRPPARPPLTPRSQPVDIVICVHNAQEDVTRCLASVLRHTAQPYRLLLVDDGSDPPTRNFLAEFAAGRSHTRLLPSDTATGYTCAANRGLRAATAPFVLLLNSDTIVTPEWLGRLVACAESDPQIGLVGPLSNTASYQSVPAISAGGDWAENPLPEGWDTARWAEAIGQQSARIYPEMPLLNGFCLLIRREVLDAIGLFDEEAFGAGYGEENDYGMRARAAGWRLALADDAWVYHAQSRSYSHSRRRELADRAGRILADRYGTDALAATEEALRAGPVLQGIRARVGVMAARAACVAEARERFAGKRLLFLLPVDAPGGGANVVLAEAEAMTKMGVDVHLFNLTRNRQLFVAAYPDNRLPIHFGEPADVPDLSRAFDGVVATWHESVAWLPASGPALGYYAQDFEARFYPPESAAYAQAAASYTVRPGLRCFTKTEWNRQEILAQTGVNCAVVGPSVDIDSFRPRPNESGSLFYRGGAEDAEATRRTSGDSLREPPRSPRRRGESETSSRSAHCEEAVRVTAMIRPSSPRRSPRLTMELLGRLSRRYGERVDITLFGVSPADPGFAELPQDFDWRLAGMLESGQVATLLAQTDIFVDFSIWQAMGLTALEAMACGAAVIVPRRGGAESFARHGENALVVDTEQADECRRALLSLMDDSHLRARLQANAIRDACKFYPERAAAAILDALFGPGAGEEARR